MAATGGAALAIGLWYQLLGAAGALVCNGLEFNREPYTHFEASAVAREERPRLVVEYFDMDGAIFNRGEVELYQFKITTQENPKGFGIQNVREILENATQAILSHENSNRPERFVGFVVASNRDIGNHFTTLREVVKGQSIELHRPESLANFGALPVPDSLFPDRAVSIKGATINKQPKNRRAKRTMRDFAVGITKKRWEATDQSINACLKAIAGLRFANVRPHRLEAALSQWLRTWGIKPGEDGKYIERILGKLLMHSGGKEVWDCLSIMRGVFESDDAVSLTSREAWRSVIDGMRGKIWPDPPTRNLIDLKGVPEWMLDRSGILGTLPDFPEAPAVTEIPERGIYLNRATPRIFALVGPGGVGKTSLLTQLFVKIGSSMWDPSAGDLRDRRKFNGYPIFHEAGEKAIEVIEGNLKTWAGRKDAVDDPVDRLALANRVEGDNPAVWLGLDGVDELDENSLTTFGKAMMNGITRYPNLRIALTSRPRQFNYMLAGIGGGRVVCELKVEEFSQSEARDALLEATNYELVTDQMSPYTIEGTSRDALVINQGAESTGFQSSIQQPLFIGVIRNMYENGEMDSIQAAYYGDPEGLRSIATNYVYIFCERMVKRLKCVEVDKRGIFNALKQLAEEVGNPQLDTKAHWENVCKLHLGEFISWNIFFRQCASSGLIRELSSTTFEWRHPSVGKYLPAMEENPQWE